MVPKGSRRLTDVDDMIISLYAGGMTIRDSQHHMATAMRVDISHETISAVTDAVLDDVMVWQNRQLDEFYPVVFLDALRIKVRDGAPGDQQVLPHMAIGVDIEGIKHILGLMDCQGRRRVVLGTSVLSLVEPWGQRRLHCLL